MSDESPGSGGTGAESTDTDTGQQPSESVDLTRLIVESFPPVRPHPRVWRGISNDLRNEGQPPSRLQWLRGLGIAAAFVLILGVTGLLVTSVGYGWPQGSADGTAIRELADPSTGAVALTVHSQPDGSSIALATETLPTLDDASTYQLWSVVGAEVVSLGVLGPSIDSSEIRLEGEPTTLALTVETIGGVAVSSATPVAVWTVAD